MDDYFVVTKFRNSAQQLSFISMSLTDTASEWWKIKESVRNWFSSIGFLYTCFIYGRFGRFYWVISRHVFWPVLTGTLFGHVWIRKDYIRD